MDRTILHCDLDYYFAQVSLLDRPELRALPVAVCGDPARRHGIILAKNPPAKKYGVKTGETINEAIRKCPYLNLLPAEYPKYIEYSDRVRKIYDNFTGHIESFGIDECWLDITRWSPGPDYGVKIALDIKKAIREDTGLTVSVGISWNKIFAKLGSDLNKPDGISDITRENYKDIAWRLPVSDLLMVGRATKAKLNKVGITTIGELAMAPAPLLKSLLGKNGLLLQTFALGMDDSPVRPLEFEFGMKGIGNSMTTVRDLVTDEDVKHAFYVIAEMVAQRMVRHRVCGRVLSIYLRDKDLEWITRQQKIKYPFFDSNHMVDIAMRLYYANWNIQQHPIRSLGIRMTDLEPITQAVQLSLLDDGRQIKRESLEMAKEKIRTKYGYDAIQRAVLLRTTVKERNPEEQHVVHPLGWFR
jgi:DNA polymerase-4